MGDFFENGAWIAIVVSLGLVILIPLIIGISAKGRSKTSVVVLGLNGRGDVTADDKELRISFFRRSFVAKKITGTIIYTIAKLNLLVRYDTKVEAGERNVALESIYATGIQRQKRRWLLLILGIIVALASIIGAVFTQELVILIGLVLALILFLCWYFQKRAVKFSILFGGMGEVGSSVHVIKDEDGDVINAFLLRLDEARKACQTKKDAETAPTTSVRPEACQAKKDAETAPTTSGRPALAPILCAAGDEKPVEPQAEIVINAYAEEKPQQKHAISEFEQYKQVKAEMEKLGFSNHDEYLAYLDFKKKRETQN